MLRYAAIDIGSNSIRMEAAEVLPGGAQKILAAERQVTRLGLSVFRTGRVSAESTAFVCGILQNWSQQLKKLSIAGLRAVATSAMRDASNQKEFLARAADAIAAPIEIISGQEEARLIHLGVQSRWPQAGKCVLMIDIGGGSAEIILSGDSHIRAAFSKQLGALRLNEVFLKNDPPKAGELLRLNEYIDERIASAVAKIGDAKIDRVIATSATASAVVCAIHRVPRSKRDAADRLRATTAQIRKLYRDIRERNLEGRRKVTGIGPRRAEIIIPGAAVLLRILEKFEAPSLYYSAAGVRDGIIADLAARGVGRELAELSREQRDIVEEMAARYGVSLRHVRKVAKLAGALFTGLQPLHKLSPAHGKLLEAAAYLHDIGHYVNDTSHHKHSYYLVANSDMPGFTQREREMIANLCRYHRKSSPQQDHANLQPLDAENRRALGLLAPLLRLADNLDRSHAQRVRSIRCFVRNNEVILELDSDKDTGLEAWATERAGEVFRQVYGHPILLAQANRS
ncbi:MAG: Ppx/GppA family phosphatase [Acidobacteriota bacterium]|nr:Ppx/GppA family phosphatase [Acidobacteriota bacterium]